MMPLRLPSRTPTPRSRTARRMLPCRIRSKWCRLPPLSTISPTLSSTHGSARAACAGSRTVAAPGSRTGPGARGTLVMPFVAAG